MSRLKLHVLANIPCRMKYTIHLVSPLTIHLALIISVLSSAALVGTTSAARRLSPTAATSPPGDTSGASANSSRRDRDSRQESSAHGSPRTYARPLQELMSVAQEGEVEELQSRVNALQARAIRLTSIAETAAETVRHNPRLME